MKKWFFKSLNGAGINPLLCLLSAETTVLTEDINCGEVVKSSSSVSNPGAKNTFWLPNQLQMLGLLLYFHRKAAFGFPFYQCRPPTMR